MGTLDGIFTDEQRRLIMSREYREVDGYPLPVETLEEALDRRARWRRVALTHGDAGSYVSTVFLGHDADMGMGQAPVCYETMAVCDEPYDFAGWRSRTRAEALARHAMVCALVGLAERSEEADDV
jgi:hypothetical protein